MSIFRIAMDNLKRHRARTAFLVMGLVVGVATVVTLMGIVRAMNLELGDELDRYGPNIVITTRYKGQELNLGGTQVAKVSFDVNPLSEDDLPKIRTIQDRESINIISPKLVGAVRMNDRQALLVGVENKSEFTMKPWFTLAALDGAAPSDELPDLALLELPESGLLFGAGAARTFGVRTGDAMTVNGRPFVVTGILNALGTEEDGLVYARLPVVQTLLGREGIYSMIEVCGFCNFCPIEDMAAQISDVLPNGRVTALRQAALVREETIGRFAGFGLALSGVALLVAALFVITTMLSSVNARTHEIGIFRTIGFRRSHIMAIILLEALMVSLFAGLAGFVAGNAVAKVAGPYLAQMQVAVPWDLILLAPAVLLSVLLAILSSIYPAVKAANLDPVEALRFI